MHCVLKTSKSYGFGTQHWIDFFTHSSNTCVKSLHGFVVSGMQSTTSSFMSFWTVHDTLLYWSISHFFFARKYLIPLSALSLQALTLTVCNTVQCREPISLRHIERHSGKCRNSKVAIEPDWRWIYENSKLCIEHHVLMSDGERVSECDLFIFLFIFFSLKNPWGNHLAYSLGAT